MPKFECLITQNIYLISTARAVLKTEKRNCIGQNFIFSQFCAVVKYSTFKLTKFMEEMPKTYKSTEIWINPMKD